VMRSMPVGVVEEEREASGALVERHERSIYLVARRTAGDWHGSTLRFLQRRRVVIRHGGGGEVWGI